MRTVRPLMLRTLYANPEKELVRMRENGALIRIAHGTYIAKPDTIPADQPWKPLFEEAAMAYATAAFGDRVPILAGIGAARHWHAIPRAIATTVIAVPFQHRSIHLATGGTIVFTVRRDPVDTIPVQSGLGTMRVTTIEQTFIDLITRPMLGNMPEQAEAAARALIPRVSRERLSHLTSALPTTTANRVSALLETEGLKP